MSASDQLPEHTLDLGTAGPRLDAFTDSYILFKQTTRINHLPGGCNILFMDAHVEYQRYPGPYPMSPAMAVLQG